MLRTVLFAFLLTSFAASAQEISGWDGEPYAETLTLAAGFEGDPRMVSVRPGGTVANPLGGPGCVGYIGRRPDVAVDYSAGEYDLTFSASSETDINLVVRTPDGRYVCDDDSGDGFDPVLTISGPQSGRYTAWVGVYGEASEYVDGVFGVSEIGQAVALYGEAPPTLANSNRALNGGATTDAEIEGWDGDPYAGTMTLEHGFPDDPQAMDVTPGGARANPLDGLGCVGYIGLLPDVVVEYTPSTWDLTFSAASETDVNLVVRAPSGRYYCDDDSGDSLNPMLTIENPAAGSYTVWVGVYGEASEYVDGVFGVSEVGRAVTVADRVSK